jgi:glycerol dehydrogenase
MKSRDCLKVFASPGRYVQGRNATTRLGSEMKQLGMQGPVCLVSSASPRRLLESLWNSSLKENGYEFSYLAFGGACTAEEAQRIADEAKRIKAKTLVAFGGGQVIDAVRAASCLVYEDKEVEVVSCPTVASTDAPCSTLCGMYHQDHSFEGCRLTRRHPTLVLVDTAVIAQAPRRMLVGGLGDALATWFEARTVYEAKSTNCLNGLPTETSSALSKLCYNIIIEDGAAAVQAVDAKAVTPALERVVEANTLLSGLGFESGGLCVAHSIHNGLTSQRMCAQYTHGEKVAFGLLTQLVLEGRPQSEIQTILRFSKSVGLPLTLKEVGIDADNKMMIREIAESSLAPGESSHNEPFEVTVDMMVDAIRAANRMGELYHAM